MKLDCFQGITWTCRIKTATISKHRADKELIKLYTVYEQESHRSFNLFQCLSREYANCFWGTFAALLRAITTISRFPRWCWCNLKLSFIARLIGFLSTDFLIFFFAIARPRRGWCNGFLIASRVKYLSVDLTGLAKTFLYSAGFLKRKSGGKVKTPSVNLDSQGSPSFCSASINDSATGFGTHSWTKAMSTSTFNFTGLVCSFHFELESRKRNLTKNR